ncbi:probable LRR receptor-like serine/threonine-protein kinase At1g53420 [Vicia villosa]|uniref:probable LRR receptor-like serine/threonine-protein kinase At1g53420 n=1 Tax=Vicia villosa TaxID=3911 RepID=UPI00273AB440|nr:probable LRR receptor-like serine/threonine-protein kinase At1g53420 [Vicia villosa]XP_058757663.1 probable LRR receptor-like serine/threonine-protein kinase At1g53420 [Vicia villosa]
MIKEGLKFKFHFNYVYLLSSNFNMIFRRINDLNGFEYAPLPQLSNLTQLNNLILRNCNISGTLPENLKTMKSLKILDLSFNNLSGTIPRTYADMNSVKYIFLTGNLLTGSVPAWEKNVSVDLSYNNFSISQGSQICQDENVNLFSTSWARNGT